jgi:hypothetical protein
LNENIDNEIRDLVKNWRVEYQGNSPAREKYDAEKAVEDCKNGLDQLEQSRKQFKEEKDKGEKLLTGTKKKIKEVITLLSSSKRRS